MERGDLNEFSVRFADMLFAKHPEWKQFSFTEQGTLSVQIPSPISGRALLIDTCDQEVTVALAGATWHEHFTKDEDDIDESFDAAIDFIDDFMADDFLAVEWQTNKGETRSWDTIPKRAKLNSRSNRRIVVKSWSGTHDCEIPPDFYAVFRSSAYIDSQQCTECGAKWSSQVSLCVDGICLGKEFYTCRCNTEWRTGHIEWAHLSMAQRRDYFFSTVECGVLLLSVGTPALFAYFLNTPQVTGALTAAGYGLAFGLVFLVVLWTLKSIYVRLSLRRCPHENQTESHNILRWYW